MLGWGEGGGVIGGCTAARMEGNVHYLTRAWSFGFTPGEAGEGVMGPQHLKVSCPRPLKGPSTE